MLINDNDPVADALSLDVPPQDPMAELLGSHPLPWVYEWPSIYDNAGNSIVRFRGTAMLVEDDNALAKFIIAAVNEKYGAVSPEQEQSQPALNPMEDKTQ